MSPTPTGRVERVGDRRDIILTREFDAPIDDVWAAITDSDRTARWIGPWSGDPESGRIALTMTAEGEGPPAEMDILACEPPRRVQVRQAVGEEQWTIDLSLVEDAGRTTLTFVHVDLDPAAVESIGPGWEYYLDRLVAAEAGGDVEAVDFEADYYPAMQDHYRTAD